MSCANIIKSHYDHYKRIADKMPGLMWVCAMCVTPSLAGNCADSAAGTSSETDQSENSAVLNIIVTELNDISKNYLSLSERLSEIGNENAAIKLQLQDMTDKFATPRSPESENRTAMSTDNRNNTPASFAAAVNVGIDNHTMPQLHNIQKQSPRSVQSSPKPTLHEPTASGPVNREKKSRPNSTCNLPANSNFESRNSVSDVDEVSLNDGEWQTENRHKRKHKPRTVNNQTEPRPNQAKSQVSRGSSPSSSDAKTAKLKTRPKSNNKTRVIVGTASPENGSSLGLCGTKKAWFHLGRVAKGTSSDDVLNFVNKTFPEVKFVVEQLESKSQNESFKLGVDFVHKDTVMDSNKWPKNTTLKRFLFWKIRALNVT